MPKLTNIDSSCICHLCGNTAFYISFNSKKMRCVEKITQCPGFIKKAEMSRQKNISKEDRIAHMKKMSKNGNKVLKSLHKNKEWIERKSLNISKAIESRGGHSGENNPMFGRKHLDQSKEKMSTKAKNRDPICYSKSTKTKISKGIAIPKEKKSSWEIYKEQVMNYTYKNWKKHQKKINPKNFERGKNYELDHKFSIFEGFKQNVSPEIIGHYVNLELIPKTLNRTKKTKCSITLEQLVKEYTQ